MSDVGPRAVEAAAKAEYKHHGPSWHTVTWETDDPTYKEHFRMAAERMLSAAAPFLYAQALRDAAEGLEPADRRTGDEFREGTDYGQGTP